MGPADPTQANLALAWEEIPVDVSFLSGAGTQADAPEVGGFTGIAVGDIDGAHAAFEQGIALGDGGAAFNLGVLLKDAREMDGAREAFSIAEKLGYKPEGDDENDTSTT